VYRIAQRFPLPLRVGQAVSSPIVSAGFIYSRLRYGLDFRTASPETAIERSLEAGN